MVLGEAQDPLHLSIIEGTDGHRTQSQGYCLKVNILRCMPSFQMNISYSSFPVLSLGPLVNSGDHYVRWRLPHCSLPQGSSGEGETKVALQGFF